MGEGAGETADDYTARTVSDRLGYLVSVGVVAIATAIAWAALGQTQLADAVMVYLLGTVLVSLRFGYGPSVLAAVLSVTCFNFFFIPPYYTLAVADLRHIVTFVVMLTVALVITSLQKRALAAQREAEAEQLRNALLSSVSHDLRTPLAVVTGAASTLLEADIGEDDRKELTGSILSEADRLNRLVQNLLDMTRVESGKLEVKKQWLPLEEVVGSALVRAERLIGARDVTTKLPNEMTLVPLDSVLIEQVLLNLIDNAVKHTPPGAPIHIEARVREGASPNVEIEVADRGPGLSEEEAPKVFDKFHRGAAKHAGVGLGLTICRGIVMAHGGEIWATRREGGGASFHFTLPVEGEPPTIAEEVLAT
jgi:two-component system, OmpR family, sensor histidine kinase KdpD